MKRLIAMVLLLAVCCAAGLAETAEPEETAVPEGISLDTLILDIELAEQAGGDEARRFVQTLALLPEGTALYTDSGLTDRYGVLTDEAQAFVVDRLVKSSPEADVLLAAINLDGAVDLFYLTQGDAVELHLDEANLPGEGAKVPGAQLWLSAASVTLSERGKPSVDVVAQPDPDELEELEPAEPEAEGVYITASTEGMAVVRAGTIVTLTAHISGFDPEVSSLQWQYSPDGGETIYDIEGANALEYSFAIDSDNLRYLWRVLVIPREA